MRARVRSSIFSKYQVILICVVILVSTVLFAQPQNWEIEIVDNNETGNDVSLKLDANGYPHIAYRGYYPSNIMRYAYWDGATWRVENVDTLSGGVSLVLDAGGYPHITNGSYDESFIRYVHNNGSGWDIQTIDTEESVGGRTSIVLDGNGQPHIGYCRAGFTPNGYVPHDPKYAWHDESGWHIETIDDGCFSGAYMSIAIDPSSQTHMTYCTMRGYTTIDITDRVRHITKTASGWLVEDLTPPFSDCSYPSMVLDAGGVPHIAYIRCASGVWYAVKKTDGWAFENVDSTGYFNGLALAVDAAGLPHIVYHRNLQYDFVYAFRNPAGWQFTIVDSGGYVGIQPSIQLGPLNRPRIAYNHGGYRDLLYAQGPPTIPLLGTVEAGELHLSWISADEISNFWLYGAPNNSYFPAGMAPGFENRLAILPPAVTSWSSPNGIGDPDIEWTYLLIPVDNSDTEIIRSNRLGERNLQMDIP